MNQVLDSAAAGASGNYALRDSEASPHTSSSGYSAHHSPPLRDAQATTNAPRPEDTPQELPPFYVLPDATTTPKQRRTIERALFVGSLIDDSDLNPFQFRVLAHLRRRQGSNACAWPSQESIADACKISLKVTRRTLRELEAMGAISADKPGSRDGRRLATEYRATQDWTPPARKRKAERPQGENVLPEKPQGGNVLPPPNRAETTCDHRAETTCDHRAETTCDHRAETSYQGNTVQGNSKKETQQQQQTPRASERPKAIAPPREGVVVGNDFSNPDPEKLEVLGGYGILGKPKAELACSELTVKEIQTACANHRAGGGHPGGMVLKLRQMAERKAAGQKPTPSASLPKGDHSTLQAITQWEEAYQSVNQRPKLQFWEWKSFLQKHGAGTAAELDAAIERVADKNGMHPDEVVELKAFGADFQATRKPQDAPQPPARYGHTTAAAGAPQVEEAPDADEALKRLAAVRAMNPAKKTAAAGVSVGEALGRAVQESMRSLS